MKNVTDNRPKKRGRGKALTPAERVTIETMHDSGNSNQAISRALDRSPEAVARVLLEAKQLLGSRAKDYVELHLRAAQLAAEDGNASPSQWALERLKVVESPKDQTGQGFTVHIGVLLPGLGPLAGTVTQSGSDGQVIEGEQVTGT